MCLVAVIHGIGLLQITRLHRMFSQATTGSESLVQKLDLSKDLFYCSYSGAQLFLDK